MVMIALIVGWLVQQVRSEAQRAVERATESEDLRDELGRRADLLDAANRCARALGSSLEVDEAFGAFIRELRSLVPFDRTAIILMEHGEVVVMATAGHLADEVLRPGEALPPGRADRGGAAHRRDRVPPRHERPRLPGGEDARRDRAPLAGCGAAPARRAADRDALDPTQRSRCVRARRDRARKPARPAGRDRCPEHPLVRGRARDGRGAPPALRPARRLRLARLARAAQPDGRRDRRGPDAAGPLARADARPADIVSGSDRRRDQPACDADRRRARHVTNRGRDVLVQLHRRGRRRARARHRRDRRDRPGRGRHRHERGPVAPARSRRPRAAPPGADEPRRERGQVLAGRRRGVGEELERERPRARVGRGSRSRHPTRPAGA